MSFANKPKRERKPLDEGGLYTAAIRSLGRQMRTEMQMRRILTARAEPGDAGREAVNAVLARLRENGYLNDAAYAETFTRLRKQNEKLGARKVRQSLAVRGVPSKIAGEAIDEQYAGQDETALVRAHLERKRIQQPKDDRETARVMRRLAAAGFSGGAIRKVLREWNVADEQMSGLDEIDSPAHEE